MKRDLFETEEDTKAAISNLTSLLQHPGWKIVLEIIEGNVEFLTQRILGGVDDDGTDLSKEKLDRARDKLANLKDVRNTPEYWIKELSEVKDQEPVSDPYEHLDSGDTNK